jgi:hypothetical protein
MATGRASGVSLVGRSGDPVRDAQESPSDRAGGRDGGVRWPDQGFGIVLERSPVLLRDRRDRGLDVLLLAHADRVVQPQRSRRVMSFPFQNPESARNSFGPLAPARATLGISSSTNRSAPREVFADPLRARMWSTSPVPARVARIG